MEITREELDKLLDEKYKCGYEDGKLQAANKNEHAFVDLGLPSGLLWATCNVGASSPEEYGDYFAWGETTPKKKYEWENYRHCNGDYNKRTKYCNDAELGENGFTDDLTELESCDDAATVNWGSNWRMPTKSEMEELKNNCSIAWTTRNGVNGLIVTGTNGHSIFLPAAGYCNAERIIDAGSDGNYWTCSLEVGHKGFRYPWYLYFVSSNNRLQHYSPCHGRSVRPVFSIKK